MPYAVLNLPLTIALKRHLTINLTHFNAYANSLSAEKNANDHETSTNTSTNPYNGSHASLLKIEYRMKLTEFFSYCH